MFIKVYPWKRYFARVADNLFFQIALTVLGMILILFFKIQLSELEIEIYSRVMGLVGLFLILPIEAFFLSKVGTTPGKWIFGIKIKKDGVNLTYKEALGRSWRVYIFGLGFGIPFIFLYTGICSYKILMRTGTTRWDKAIKSTIIHYNYFCTKITNINHE